MTAQALRKRYARMLAGVYVPLGSMGYLGEEFIELPDGTELMHLRATCIRTDADGKIYVREFASYIADLDYGYYKRKKDGSLRYVKPCSVYGEGLGYKINVIEDEIGELDE